MEHPVPVPVKQPIAVPVQQPYPVPVRHPVPVPIPVPVPVPVHPLPPPAFPLIPTGGLAGAIYARDYVPDHLYPVHSAALHGLHLDHGIAPLAHGLAHGYGHGYDYHDAHADHLAHGHEHKKRKTDKN